MNRIEIKLKEEQWEYIEDCLINYMHGIKMYRVACSYDRGYQNGIQIAEDYMLECLSNLRSKVK